MLEDRGLFGSTILQNKVWARLSYMQQMYGYLHISQEIHAHGKAFVILFALLLQKH